MEDSVAVRGLLSSIVDPPSSIPHPHCLARPAGCHGRVAGRLLAGHPGSAPAAAAHSSAETTVRAQAVRSCWTAWWHNWHL